MDTKFYIRSLYNSWPIIIVVKTKWETKFWNGNMFYQETFHEIMRIHAHKRILILSHIDYTNYGRYKWDTLAHSCYHDQSISYLIFLFSFSSIVHCLACSHFSKFEYVLNLFLAYSETGVAFTLKLERIDSFSKWFFWINEQTYCITYRNLFISVGFMEAAFYTSCHIQAYQKVSHKQVRSTLLLLRFFQLYRNKVEKLINFIIWGCILCKTI